MYFVFNIYAHFLGEERDRICLLRSAQLLYDVYWLRGNYKKVIANVYVFLIVKVEVSGSGMNGSSGMNGLILGCAGVDCRAVSHCF